MHKHATTFMAFPDDSRAADLEAAADMYSAKKKDWSSCDLHSRTRVILSIVII